MNTITTESVYVNINAIGPDIQFARFHQGSGSETSELTLTLRNQSQPLQVSGIAAGECWAALKQYVQVQIGQSESEQQKTRVQSAGSQR